MQLYIAWVTGFYYVMPHFVVRILCVKLVSRYTSWHGVFPMALFPDSGWACYVSGHCAWSFVMVGHTPLCLYPLHCTILTTHTVMPVVLYPNILILFLYPFSDYGADADAHTSPFYGSGHRRYVWHPVCTSGLNVCLI